MINKSLFSSNSIEWSTPQKLYDELNKEFNFTLDPCATKENHKCDKYYTKEENGLLKCWSNEVVFCNPPYGRKDTSVWIKKCFDEWCNYNITIVMLLPSRTDTKAFHEYIYPYCEIRFIKGRLKFNESGSAPFPSMLCIYRKEVKE